MTYYFEDRPDESNRKRLVRVLETWMLEDRFNIHIGDTWSDDVTDAYIVITDLAFEGEFSDDRSRLRVTYLPVDMTDTQHPIMGDAEDARTTSLKYFRRRYSPSGLCAHYLPAMRYVDGWMCPSCGAQTANREGE